MQATVDFDISTALAIPVAGGRRFYLSTTKRAVDVVLAALALFLTLPLWIVIAVAIKMDSPGPIFFIQERVGMGGRPFRFVKFRSMSADAESLRAGLVHRNEVDGPVFKIRNDPRSTRVGRILRRYSLDELPQLINVLIGDMTLVGPRPPLPSEVEQYRPEDRLRLTVKPGLTCLWVIRGRSHLGFEEWMAADREYIEHLSFWLDVTILVRTVSVALSGRGAY